MPALSPPRYFTDGERLYEVVDRYLRPQTPDGPCLRWILLRDVGDDDEVLEVCETSHVLDPVRP